MKKVLLHIFFVLISFTVFGESYSRKGDFRLCSKVMIPALVGFTSSGVGGHYSFNNHWDIYGEFSILIVPIFNQIFNFHSTVAARYYFTEKEKSLFMEAGCGLFSSITSYSNSLNSAPVGILNIGYEFPLKSKILNIDVGFYCLIDTGFLSPIPILTLPALTFSLFF